MKSFLVLCVLVGATSAFIPSRKTTLREYLEALPEPDALAKRQADADVPADLDCANVCPPLPTLDLSATCEGNKWAPNYESKDGCECLTEYKCCSDSCDPVSEEQCWEDGKKGYYYGMKAKDCCDCPVIKCQPCIKPAPKEEVCGKKPKYPLKCYEYIAEATMDNVTACFEASCSYNPPDPPKDENCDADCMSTDTKSTECGADYKVCKKNRGKSECPNSDKNKAKQKILSETGLGGHCFEEPDKVVDPLGGKYADPVGDAGKCGREENIDYPGNDIPMGNVDRQRIRGCQKLCHSLPNCAGFTFDKQARYNRNCYPKTKMANRKALNGAVSGICELGGDDMECKPCKKWIFEKKNCTKMNEQARMEDCHMAGTDELDKKCFTKTITPDSCKCEHATCQRKDDVDEQNKFEPDDKCPKNHKKVTGVTICMKARDLCVQCPAVIEPTCGLGSFASDDTDCNGCPIKRCEKFSIVALKGACDCGLYEAYDNTLYCTCTEEDKAGLADLKALKK